MTKYHAVPTVIDGTRFASKREATRYQRLLMLQAAGEIRDLELQPRFPLTINGFRVGTYVADFRYCTRDGRVVVEDVKGVRTPVYRLKSKLLRAMGWETANMHARDPRRAAVLRDLSRRADGWLQHAAEEMAAATVADWRQWKRA